jgi:hypothetical protein
MCAFDLIAPMKVGDRMKKFSLSMALLQAPISFSVAHTLSGFCVVLLAVPPAHGEGEAPRESFLQQYQPHAKTLESAYANVQVKWRQSSEIDRGTLSVGYIDGKYNRLNYCWHIKSATVDSKTKQIISLGEHDLIDCRNAHASFQLRRQDKNHEYSLRKLNIFSGHEPVLDIQSSLSPLNVPYADYIKKKSYLEVAQDPETQIIGFEDCVWQNETKKALTTRFAYFNPGSKKQTDCITVYFFSPEKDWICCGMKSYVADGSAREGLEERYYYEKDNELPPLKRIEQWVYNLQDSSKSRLRGSTEIDEFHRSSIPFPDSEFTLSAFGLPEPMGVPAPEKPSRTWLWLLAAAVGSVAVAILFALLKRRHALNSALGSSGRS